ncbi:kinase-like domain-containing protein [Hygrophoropsis aurantiaca]|uniref:Kinase-like domain-containing protein n=1 Tax=Hygrophoropsis aurantiaca TaxID=72124 RepID=A0ACB8A7L8_9AGAM|nr:kinase-like domain-containing protein [Hygrophoropsis aurantiaca]
MSNVLELYEPLDIIGNGSFGIIRKVRRKSDGLVYARKELNFERMSERDRKQIVAEVNILKDLHHEHIVRYHDRHVDRDAGILYILMEYCGGGDLSTVIKQAQKHNRPVPEDTIWHYFMQILLALHHCHHPSSPGKSGSGSENDGRDKRPQILHRDLKPDNVFLDEANTVKLGDFGLSKALAQASFANTYVGTPYYMSPELMQEKAYDSKSDIWSLGCLIYELCALKPPFHEAKTHAELSIFIRNGRIPPLPRGYSSALSNVIKAMLNLNPAMRPSAAQLLQHERLELVFKVSETEKMLSTVKTHKAAVAAKEREVSAREGALAEKESHLTNCVAEKDAEISRLHNQLTQARTHIDTRIREAISKREEELRVAVMKREEEVAAAMARREAEILDAVRQREQEIFEAWRAREDQIRLEMAAAVEEKAKWASQREQELDAERIRLDTLREDLEAKVQALSAQTNADGKGRGDKTPLEEVKNLLAPLVQMTEERSRVKSEKSHPRDGSDIATPMNRNIARFPADYQLSAMKGVVLTQTGEPLATPTPAELANLFVNSPKVGLDFAKIFDFESEIDGRSDVDSSDEEALPPSPSKRERPTSEQSNHSSGPSREPSPATVAPPTRLRKPSIRGSAQRAPLRKAATLPPSSSDPTGFAWSSNPSKSSSTRAEKPVPTRATTTGAPSQVANPTVEYDLSDEENLPSPFLKRIDRERAILPGGGTLRTGATKRPSTGNLLRVVAAANAANAVSRAGNAKTSAATIARPSLASARKASEDARKALLRQS